MQSAITGGTEQETDAELMARCRYNTADAGIGSYNGLWRKLQKAPVNVSGLSVVAGEDPGVLRARWNNLSINPGGVIDCYVRTQAQSSKKTVQATANANGTVTIENDSAYRVNNITYNNGGAETIISGY